MEPEMQKEAVPETGRWKTRTGPARYIRQIDPSSGAVARWHALHQGKSPSSSDELLETPDENHLPEE